MIEGTWMLFKRRHKEEMGTRSVGASVFLLGRLLEKIKQLRVY